MYWLSRAGHRQVAGAQVLGQRRHLWRCIVHSHGGGKAGACTQLARLQQCHHVFAPQLSCRLIKFRHSNHLDRDHVSLPNPQGGDLPVDGIGAHGVHPGLVVDVIVGASRLSCHIAGIEDLPILVGDQDRQSSGIPDQGQAVLIQGITAADGPPCPPDSAPPAGRDCPPGNKPWHPLCASQVGYWSERSQGTALWRRHTGHPYR